MYSFPLCGISNVHHMISGDSTVKPFWEDHRQLFIPFIHSWSNWSEVFNELPPKSLVIINMMAIVLLSFTLSNCLHRMRSTIQLDRTLYLATASCAELHYEKEKTCHFTLKFSFCCKRKALSIRSSSRVQNCFCL